MARTIYSVGICLIATIVAVSAAPQSSAPAAHPGKMLMDCGHCDWAGDEFGCCDHCCCHHKVPEITVHVIQPPPTFIYDVTHTACYTEHHDCCGCPYVCGPTCLPQGEVLAPSNAGRKVNVEGGYHGGHYKAKH
ncbi:hypothetical protein GGI07_003236 [Coemansia sp. Benny D115]|nr:hypothetical protein GGI07_003236 [Coemansia sp. Benny D115]